jgi:phage gpG-like protein
MAYKSPGVNTNRTKNFKVKFRLGGASEFEGLNLLMTELRETIAKVSKVSSDMRPLWKVVEAEVLAGIDKIFKTEGDEIGHSWPKLNNRYAKKKRDEGRDRGILIYTGVMKASIRVGRQTNNAIKIVTDDPKAPIHNFGRGDMPWRPFMSITDEAQKNIIEAFDVVYTKAMNNEANPRPRENWSETSKRIKGQKYGS